MENCSTILYWSLPYMNMNQPQVYICPLSLEASSHLPPPTPSHPSRFSQSAWCELPASYPKFPWALFYIWSCTCFHAALSTRPSPSRTVSTILFSVCVSTAGLRIGSSVLSTVLSVLRMHPTGSVQSSAHSLSLCSFATKIDTPLGSIISFFIFWDSHFKI